MNLVHVVPQVDREASGLSHSVPNLCGALVGLGNQVDLFGKSIEARYLQHLLGEDAVLLSLLGFELKIYMVNKVIATALVMVWNYFTKRWVLKG